MIRLCACVVPARSFVPLYTKMPVFESISDVSSSSLASSDHSSVIIGYIVYAAFDCVFSVVTFYRLIGVLIVWNRLHKNQKQLAAPTSDAMTPLMSNGSFATRDQNLDLKPKASFFGLMFFSCLSLFPLLLCL